MEVDNKPGAAGFTDVPEAGPGPSTQAHRERNLAANSSSAEEVGQDDGRGGGSTEEDQIGAKEDQTLNEKNGLKCFNLYI